MATNALFEPVSIDERGIPVFDPALLPDIVRSDYGWHEILDELRERHPYFRLGDNPVIYFSRYDTARKIYLDWRTFSSKKPYDDPYLLPLDEDPPRGLEIRRALLPQYSPVTVAAWEPRIREIAQDLIQGFVSQGECEYVAEFSSRYFPFIGCEWIGAPKEDHEMLSKWQHEAFRVPPKTRDERELVTDLDNSGMMNIIEYCRNLLDAKRGEPKDSSFASYVLHMEVEGEPLTDRERLGCLTQGVIGSGHTVTAHLGYVMRYFAETPDDRRRIAADPDLIDNAGEELLRVYSLGGIERWVTDDTELDGCPLRHGDSVLSLATQANRDPRCEGRAGETHPQIDLERRPNQHLGFQVGVHQCLGMHWARAARRIAVEEWHRAIPDYSIKPGAVFHDQVYAGVGLQSLPLVWDAGAA